MFLLSWLYRICTQKSVGPNSLVVRQWLFTGKAPPKAATAMKKSRYFLWKIEATLGQLADTVLARRADDDNVVVPHVGSSVPACSATMYSAYQSGQFASRCPVRFSCCPWAASARRSALARSLT